MGITVYASSVSGNKEMKKQQQRITMVLDGKGIAYTVIDISASEEDKKTMRDLVGDPKALPPQIFNGDVHCGDFAAFDLAVEDGKINEFLKL
ncbi:SH3 domain-binding glutamic acid-rich-like protein 3 [Sebastes fasciatus]|uniref:SH3 domain-binding glutamic acid-rich-like protein 3 n=1 Tax=Sebastes fasciatus TaxID=394691 RepID=UPI003D9E44EF